MPLIDVHFSHLNKSLAVLPTEGLSKQDIRWLSWTLDLASTSDYPRPNFRVGATIIHRGKIIGHGVNSRKTHPFAARTNDNSIQLHAEMVALLAAQKNDFDPDKAIIYVARSRQGNPGCSYPCRFCWAALLHVGIKNVVCFDRHGLPQKIIT